MCVPTPHKCWCTGTWSLLPPVCGLHGHVSFVDEASEDPGGGGLCKLDGAGPRTGLGIGH